MQKIIVAFDGLNFSESANSYARELASLNNAYLTGVFLDDRTYTSYKIYDLVLKDGVSEKKIKNFRELDRLKRESSTLNFEKSSQHAGLQYNVHHDHNVALQELIHESIYADFLIVDEKETLTHYDDKHPSRFIKDVLADVQCPVLVVPASYKAIEKVVLLYDGTPSSVFAIKMFSYLLPNFKKLPIELLSVKDVEDDFHLPDNKLIKDFLKRHYAHVNYSVLKGISDVEIVNYFSNASQNFLIVSGAYKRSDLSRWFKTSIADILIKNSMLPLFIAHSK